MMPQLLYPGLTSLLFLLFVLQISAHMMISSPPPLGSSSNPNLRSSDIDYNLKDPLSPSGLTYPCGPNFDLYSLSPQGNPVAIWAAGSSQSFTLDGGASHNGGSCQASLSIDGGKSFKVLRSYEGGCPLKRNYQFSIPADVPATKKAVFAWTWFNQIGNREMYMNCAVVDITPGSGGKGGWAKKPEVFKANIGNGCTTVERFDVEFPNPGDDVARGGEGIFASPVGDCGTVNRGADSGAGEGSGNIQGGGTDSGNGGANQNPDSPPAGDSPGSSTTDPTRPSQPNSGDDPDSSYVPPIGDWKPGRDFPEWFNKNSGMSIIVSFPSVLMALTLSFLFHIGTYYLCLWHKNCHGEARGDNGLHADIHRHLVRRYWWDIRLGPAKLDM